MLDDETTVDPRLPVSDAEYEAALTAARPQLPGEVEGNRASGVEMALIAAHAVLVPRIERALNDSLLHFRVGSDSLFRDYGECCLSVGAINELRAAFWRAMEEA